MLDQLERYQVYIRRLKRWDRDSFALYRRLGAFLVPEEEAILIHRKEIEPIFLQNLPGFGAICVAMSREMDKRTDDLMPVRFAYFSKLQRPGHDVERVNAGVTYRLHIYWDDKDVGVSKGAEHRFWKERGHGFGQDYLVNITPDGTIRALRVLKTKAQTIRHKDGQHSTIEHQRWGLPWLPDKMTKNPAEEIRELFTIMLNWWVAAAHNSMIRITATKDGLVMPFVIDATKTPQFFADREPVIVGGVKKRIFHVVRAHSRNGKGVRLHFAGLRNFMWNGYSIAITVPGREHLDLADFPVGVLEDLPEDQRADTLNPEQLGEWVADHIGAPGKEHVA